MSAKPDFESLFRARPKPDVLFAPKLTFEPGTAFHRPVEAQEIIAHELREREQIVDQRLREGLELAKMAVWDWDLGTGEIVYSENAAAVFGGLWANIAEGWKCVHPDDVEYLERTVEKALAEGGSYHAINRLIRPDTGEVVWLSNRGQVVYNADGSPRAMRGVSVDITERQRAEMELQRVNQALAERVRELARAEEALRQADLRKDEFLAMLAHELRNPLAPIRAAAELLRLGRLDAASIEKTSQVIARQVGHMTGLVNDLLDVSRVTRGLVALDKETLDVRDVVADAIEQTRPLLDARGHRLTVRLPQEASCVLGDHKRLVQVLANLLANSAKYTAEHGDIRVSLELEPEQVVLGVSDNGIGIAPEVLPHVFDLFAQAKRTPDRSQGGLGLGLALVKSLVELHGGSVAARSDGQHGGSDFVVTLPRLAGSAALPEAGEARGDQPDGSQPLRVLVVDDNMDAAGMLQLLLERRGYRVTVEHHAQPALARAAREAFDVFLLDIGLPGIDGRELARRLRKMPFAGQSMLVAITGYGQCCDKAGALECGFDHYFIKPVDSARLLALLAPAGAYCLTQSTK